ncbi:hypothetical protein [Marinifilum fragile]|uniref:hypothetical protein n=1 Tax=Marinifilum fragile TaxID=570161 RepID=UPI002AA6BC28|nr:hypothetical protein [Marinifilum fragile]
MNDTRGEYFRKQTQNRAYNQHVNHKVMRISLEQGGRRNLNIVSDINGFVGLGAEWFKGEMMVAFKQVYKYGQSYYMNGERYVKSALQITRESKVYNLRSAKFMGRIGATSTVANTVINGAQFAMNPTADQGVWSSGMIALGAVSVVCPPLLIYSVGLDQIGKDVIRETWENDMYMYRKYGQLPRYY